LSIAGLLPTYKFPFPDSELYFILIAGK